MQTPRYVLLATALLYVSALNSRRAEANGNGHA
jgi:hypothetical protein